MRYAKRMLLIPEDMYKRLMSSPASSASIANTLSQPTPPAAADSRPEDLPIALAEARMAKILGDRRKRNADARHAHFSETYKRYRTMVKRASSRPLRVVDARREEPTATITTAATVSGGTPPVSARSPIDSSVAGDDGDDDDEAFEDAADEPASSRRQPLDEAAVSALLNHFLANKKRHVDATLHLIDPSTKKRMRKSNLRKIIEYHLGAPNPSGDKAPPGYQMFLNAIKNDEYFIQNNIPVEARAKKRKQSGGGGGGGGAQMIKFKVKRAAAPPPSHINAAKAALIAFKPQLW